MLILLVLCTACDRKKDEVPVMPPLSSPLSQPYIGFGVVNVSFTRITAEPAGLPAESASEGISSPGYLRRGAIVCIHERRLVRERGLAGAKPESWVLVEGIHQTGNRGWLKESLVDVYDTELQARTASESMSR